MLTHIDLFSGIGGFALAAKWAGFVTVAFCEIEPYCQALLRQNFPGVPVFADINELTGEQIWRELEKEFAPAANRTLLQQIDPTVSRATPSECSTGETETERSTGKHQENGANERKTRFSGIMAESAPVAERAQESFSPSTTKIIMGKQSGKDTTRKLGRLYSHEDCPTIIKSSVSTATYRKDFTEYAPIRIDLLTAGVPCQPASQAGKRRGAQDDRWLWPQTFRVIRELHPRWCILENVPGILALDGGMEFERLLTTLEGEGYAVQPLVIPACAVDAKHRRDRVWIVGHAEERGIRRGQASRSSGQPAQSSEDVADTARLDTGRALLQGRRAEESARWQPEPDVGRVAHGIPARVHRLKGLGNAIVPQVAYQIIKVIAELERRRA